MSRKFIAAITACAIAFSGVTATQAQADNKQLKRFIVGATALAILGAAMSDSRADGRAYVGTRDQRPRRHGGHNRGHGYDRHHDHGHTYGRNHDTPRWNGNGPRPRPLPRRIERSYLPERCLTSVQTRRGRLALYSQACLNRHYRLTHALPGQCRIKVRTNRGPLLGYTSRCLARNGWLERG